LSSKALSFRRLNPAERTLFGPDLSNASPRARQGLIAMLQGAADPDFVAVFEEARTLLRSLWRTANEDTFIIPGTEEAGLEAVLVNLVEPGDVVLVCVGGYGGERIAEAAGRLGGRVERLETTWGTIVEPATLQQALATHAPRLVAVVHGDGSTGVLQPLPELAALAHEHDAVLAVDVSLTTAVVEVLVDEWELDACWAGSQKGLSAYPGLALVTFAGRAAERIEQRRTPVAGWYLELEGLRSLASDERRHQTLPAPLVFALTEVLQLAHEQSMEYREGRHRNRSDALVAALEALGLEVLADPEHRLPSVTVVRVPDGVDGERVRKGLLAPFRIDIGGGLGAWKNQVWRIGILSHSAQPSFLVQFVSLLEILLEREGYPIPDPGRAVRVVVDALEP
jgi:alanine-glyoxylate transaminase / serine-glyoxylate transaminase / serine-pyruvate transaminase